MRIFEASFNVIKQYIQRLKSQGQKRQSTNDELSSALVFAADEGNVEMAKNLIKAGANINGMPLLIAIQANSEAVVEELIAAGADVNRPCANTTPLVRAVEARLPYIVNLLVNSGANVNLRASKGVTPLMAAIRPGRTNASQSEEQEIIYILKRAGAK